MHRKFDQYKKPCCKGHFPVYSLSSVIRKVSNNSVAGCPPCKAFFFPKWELRSESQSWMEFCEERIIWNGGSCLCLALSPSYPVWLAITALLPYQAMSPTWRTRKSLGCWWLDGSFTSSGMPNFKILMQNKISSFLDLKGFFFPFSLAFLLSQNNSFGVSPTHRCMPYPQAHAEQRLNSKSTLSIIEIFQPIDIFFLVLSNYF